MRMMTLTAGTVVRFSNLGSDTMPQEFTFPLTGFPLPTEFFSMLTQWQIQTRIAEMAPVINRHMHASVKAGHRLTAVSLLNGAVPFFNSLHQHLYEGCTPINLDASSYVGQTAGETMINEKALNRNQIEGRIIYLEDDLVDGGPTMSKVMKLLYEMGALQVIPISLLDKPGGRKSGYESFSPVLTGFIIPDVWVWGFGMDDGWDEKEWPHDNEWVRMVRSIWNYGRQVDSNEIMVPPLAELPLAA